MKIPFGENIKSKLEFMKLIKPYMTNPRFFVGLFALRFLTLLSGLIAPVFYKIMVDDVLIDRKLNLLWIVIAGYAGVFLVETLFTAVATIFQNKACYPLILRLEEKLLKIIMDIPVQNLSKFDAGDLKTRILDGDMLVGFIDHNILEYCQAAVTAIVTSVILLFIDYRLAFISFLSVPISFAMTKFLGKKKLASAQSLRTERVKFDGYIHSTIQNWKQVKILSLENEQDELFTGYRKNISSLFMKNQVYWYLNRTFISIKDFFVTKMNLYFIGGLLIFSGGFSVGSLLVFMVYFDKMFQSLETINDLDMRFINDKPAIDRISETLAMSAAVRTGTRTVSEFQSLSFRNVSFSYGDGLPDAIQNISFELKRGGRMALSGKSGCGKSTIIKLMLGSYENYSGEILLNGINIKEIKKTDLRNLFGVVMQEPYLFNLSIRENLLLLSPNRYFSDDVLHTPSSSGFDKHLDELSEDELWESLRLAAIHDFVASLPDGLDSVIGEKGIKLSGGQRQRLAIARALLKKPDVFIFDEATSALDHESEKAVHDAIQNFSKEQTVVLISHRPTTMALAEDIIYI